MCVENKSKNKSSKNNVSSVNPIATNTSVDNIDIDSTTTTTTSSDSVIKRKSDSDDDNDLKRQKCNPNNEKLQKAIINFFDNTENYIIKNINIVFKVEPKKFNSFKNYCLSEPSLIFKAIDYIYPHIKNNNYKNNIEEIQAYLKVLEEGFQENFEIAKFLNKYSKNILTLIEKSVIRDALYKLVLVLLLDLCDYHGIHDLEFEKEPDLKELIKKEYLHRYKKK